MELGIVVMEGTYVVLYPAECHAHLCCVSCGEHVIVG